MVSLSRVFASHQSRSASFSCGTMLWLQRLKAKWEIISSQHGLWSQGAFANCWLLHISLCAPDFSSSTDKTNEKLKYKRESSIRNRVFFNWDTNIDHILPLCTYKDIHLYINGLQCVLFALVILFWQSQVSRSSYFLTFNCRVSIYNELGTLRYNSFLYFAAVEKKILKNSNSKSMFANCATLSYMSAVYWQWQEWLKNEIRRNSLIRKHPRELWGCFIWLYIRN